MAEYVVLRVDRDENNKMILEPFRYFRLYRRKERRIRPSNQRERLVRCIRRSCSIMRAGECLCRARDVDVFLPQAQFGCNLGSHLIFELYSSSLRTSIYYTVFILYSHFKAKNDWPPT